MPLYLSSLQVKLSDNPSTFHNSRSNYLTTHVPIITPGQIIWLPMLPSSLQVKLSDYPCTYHHPRSNYLTTPVPLIPPGQIIWLPIYLSSLQVKLSDYSCSSHPSRSNYLTTPVALIHPGYLSIPLYLSSLLTLIGPAKRTLAPSFHSRTMEPRSLVRHSNSTVPPTFTSIHKKYIN